MALNLSGPGSTEMEAVLARGVRIIAEIHHSHGIKAALAVRHLRNRFPHWTDSFWLAALEQARWFEEPVVDHPAATLNRKVSPQRAPIILERSVVPLAYAAVRAWAAASGVEAIIRFFTEQAAADPGYLGHRLSILLALGEAWPLYRGGAQQDLYLDRLTEFILACRFTASSEGAAGSLPATWDDACAAAARHPGFFGHNLICLAWIGRSRATLADRHLQSSLGWLVAATATIYPDAEDNLEIAAMGRLELSDSDLEAALQDLLLRGKRNIHLLTLADAVAWLWDDPQHDARPYLIELARYHTNRDAT